MSAQAKKPKPRKPHQTVMSAAHTRALAIEKLLEDAPPLTDKQGLAIAKHLYSGTTTHKHRNRVMMKANDNEHQEHDKREGALAA